MVGYFKGSDRMSDGPFLTPREQVDLDFSYLIDLACIGNRLRRIRLYLIWVLRNLSRRTSWI